MSEIGGIIAVEGGVIVKAAFGVDLRRSAAAQYLAVCLKQPFGKDVFGGRHMQVFYKNVVQVAFGSIAFPPPSRYWARIA